MAGTAKRRKLDKGIHHHRCHFRHFGLPLCTPVSTHCCSSLPSAPMQAFVNHPRHWGTGGRGALPAQNKNESSSGVYHIARCSFKHVLFMNSHCALSQLALTGADTKVQSASGTCSRLQSQSSHTEPAPPHCLLVAEALQVGLR